MTRSGSHLVFVPYEEVYGHGIEDMHHRIPAIEKIRAAVGWRAVLDLDVVLADVIKDVRNRTVTGEQAALATAGL